VSLGGPTSVVRKALLLVPIVVVAGLTLRSLWRRRRHDANPRVPASRATGALLMMVATALCLPPGWNHYFAFMPVALAAVLARSDCRSLDVGLVVAAWLATALPVFDLARGNAGYFLASQWSTTTWAGLCVWWALLRAHAHDDGDSARSG
jgi:hypothetical protein